MWIQRKRLERDLVRWREAGWVTPAGEAAIREDLTKGGGGPGLATSLSVLAAVLIGFAAMSFVAANWQDMSRLARLGLLFSGLVASYGLAGMMFQRDMEAFAHAAILLGVAIFGASIMLISQMYHMDGNAADAVLVWALGGLLAGILLRSNPALAFAMVLVCTWAAMETGQRNGVFWPFLLGWAAVAVALYWRKWPPGVHVAGLPLATFVISLGYFLSDGHAHGLVTLIGLGIAGLAIFGEQARPDLPRLWSGMLGYAIAIAFAGLWALQFVDEPGLDALIVLAVITLALLVAAIWWGMKTGHRGALWLGYLGFSIEVLAIYAKKFGSLLDTSLFFLVAGVLVAGLAYMAYRLHDEAKEARA
ncbi:MAG: DUF2157 domain-containing protein [Hyphomicrobium sp.]